MRFTFSQDQLLFQDSVRGFLDKECTAAQVRALWQSDSGRSRERWHRLAAIGVLGILVPEAHGGSGVDEVDLVLPLEETGRAALPEPLVESAAVGVALLVESGDQALQQRWLGPMAAGEAIATVAHPLNPCICDAHVADLLLLECNGEVHALEPDQVELEAQPCSDPARRLFIARWQPRKSTRVAAGEAAQDLLAAALDRGAMAVAAQQLGLAQQLIDLAVAYAKEREQFGRPIGSFQAIKHMLASTQVAVEFARPVVYRAAHSVAHAAPTRAVHVSQAKTAADEAAVAAAKTALQVHGAIGYTWEVDLHLWMKRVWALQASWGSRLWHRRRIAETLFASASPPPSFGFRARAREFSQESRL